eukprot:5171152-Pyramimonas_sp.AAC.2
MVWHRSKDDTARPKRQRPPHTCRRSMTSMSTPASMHAPARKVTTCAPGGTCTRRLSTSARPSEGLPGVAKRYIIHQAYVMSTPRCKWMATLSGRIKASRDRRYPLTTMFG